MPFAAVAPLKFTSQVAYAPPPTLVFIITVIDPVIELYAETVPII